MPNSKSVEHLKAFGMTNQILAEDLSRVAKQYGVDLGHMVIANARVEDIYYPQFEATVRREAEAMSKHYEVFYCLEKSIRALVSDTIETAERTERWWASSGCLVLSNLRLTVVFGKRSTPE